MFTMRSVHGSINFLTYSSRISLYVVTFLRFDKLR